MNYSSIAKRDTNIWYQGDFLPACHPPSMSQRTLSRLYMLYKYKTNVVAKLGTWSVAFLLVPAAANGWVELLMPIWSNVDRPRQCFDVYAEHTFDGTDWHLLFNAPMWLAGITSWKTLRHFALAVSAIAILGAQTEAPIWAPVVLALPLVLACILYFLAFLMDIIRLLKVSSRIPSHFQHLRQPATGLSKFIWTTLSYVCLLGFVIECGTGLHDRYNETGRAAQQ